MSLMQVFRATCRVTFVLGLIIYFEYKMDWGCFLLGGGIVCGWE